MLYCSPELCAALGHIMGKPADTEPEPDVEKRLNIVQRAGKWLYLG